jgi:hypothetical protein
MYDTDFLQAQAERANELFDITQEQIDQMSEADQHMH